MNWRTVDMSRESRRDQFAYFQTLSNPYVGVTVQVDVTELAVWCRERGTSFFLAMLYAAVRAANGVPELRRRIRGDQVVEYDRCPSSHTVALPDGTYCYCSLEDRLVKNKFRRWAQRCTCPPEQPICTCGGVAKAKLITRKPIEADAAELETNRRSRSAKLRVLEKA